MPVTTTLRDWLAVLTVTGYDNPWRLLGGVSLNELNGVAHGLHGGGLIFGD